MASTMDPREKLLEALGGVTVHPIATALATVATAWLLYESKKHDVQRRAISAASAAADAVGGTVKKTRQATSAGGEFASNVWDEHPLAAGAALMAVSIAAGAMLPATSIEQSVAGERSAQLLEKARSGGGRIVREGRKYARKQVRKTADAAMQEAAAVGLSPKRVSRKVKRIVSRVTDSIAAPEALGGE